jgi:predicted Zn-dependent protease
VENLVTAFHHEGLRVTNYRIELVDVSRLSLGIQDGIVAGVYSPLRRVDSLTVSLFLEWSDGRVSLGLLSGPDPAGVTEVLKSSLAARYEDEDARVFLGPQSLNPVPLHSAETAALYTEKLDFFYDIVGLLTKNAEAEAVANLSGGISAFDSRVSLKTSKGLSLHSESTNFSYYYNYDGIIGDSHDWRSPFTLQEIEDHVTVTSRNYRWLRRKPAEAGGGHAAIIFHPNLVDELLQHYIISNLYAQRILHGQSPWSLGAFRDKARVFRTDVGLVMDPTVPLSPGAYLFTAEGVPAKREVYILNGCLQTPIVSLKYTRRMGMPPSCPPGSRYSLRVEHGGAVGFDAAVQSIGSGFLVFSALGMHTQDRISGGYSLLSPRSLYIRGGEIQGPVSISINGNFFENLNEEATAFVAFGGYRSPGMRVDASVSVVG